jgi:hypothetical protein
MPSSAPGQTSARRGWLARVLAWGASAISCVALLGCGDETVTCTSNVSCPARFLLSDWCSSEGHCNFDGASDACQGGVCTLPKGKTLRVPVAQIWGLLTDTHDLYLEYALRDEGTPDPEEASVRLDGVTGVHHKRRGNATSVQWSFPPASASLVEISFTDGRAAEADLFLAFENDKCEESRTYACH